MPDDERPRLNYEEQEVLADQGKRFLGIRQATWVDDRSICTTCKHSQIIRRSGKNTQVIYCSDLGKWVPGDIAECSSHQGFTELSVHQMSSIATLIGGLPEKKVGFTKE